MSPSMMARWLCALTVGLAAAGVGRAEGDYGREVKPLLQARCFACHGALKQEGGLRLDTAAAARQGGDSGSAVASADAGGSLIIERVTAAVLDDRMPPEHEGESLTPAEIEILRGWIDAGAPGPAGEAPEADPRDHWAFRPVVRPAVPIIAGPWGRHAIDAFIAKRHQDHGLVPQPEAPPEVLWRRLYLDLIGLPPSAESLASVMETPAPGWYEEAVDRLLADPRHGERWARHWMDVWRYSDWWGLGDQLRNSQKHLWHWRDWIVESLNADVSYADMIRLMLAGDELRPGDPSALRATGFLARNYFLFNRNQWMDETVEHVSKGLLGLTMNCAKCHDHKYDPLGQKDYYRLRAYFEPYHVRLDVLPGEADLERDGLPRVYDGWLEEPTWRFIRGDETRPDKSVAMAPGVPGLLAFRKVEVEPVALPPAAWQPERQPWVIEAHGAYARRQIEAAIAARDSAAEAAAKVEARPSEKLAMARSASPPDAPTPEAARRAVEVVKARLASAEQAVVLARARLRSVEARGAALRASWAETSDAPAQKVTAVRAEREAAVEATRHAVAEKEFQRLEAVPDKVEQADKELSAAREARDTALQAADDPVAPDATFAGLPGAKWTPTRFRNSTADDPDVPFPAHSTGRRTALAHWMADAKNPLTARVAVNHIWARHFGTPLVATVFDFGRKGAAPTHPELLDWLAAEFMEHGWSQKHLHRLIVTSWAYRLTSSLSGGEESMAKDPDNVHFWHRAPVRLEAEVVRDAILAQSGELDPAMGGPPVAPGAQDDSKRRSLYFFHSNNDRNVFLTTFDGAAVKECYRREQSVVPQQALALTNSRLVQEAARKIADRFSQPPSQAAAAVDDTAFVRRVWLELLAIRASGDEVAACLKALERWRALVPDDPGAARAQLVGTLLNHNDFVTQR